MFLRLRKAAVPIAFGPLNEESVGSHYLFYLDDGDKSGRWIGFGCGRSTLLDRASEDLLFLDNLDKVKGKTRISGTVQFDVEDDKSPSLGGLTITIQGNGRTNKVKTDKNGVYEIYGLPPGLYTIAPDIPRGFKVDEFYLRYNADLIGERDDEGDIKSAKRLAVRVGEMSPHASLDFHFEINNAFSGRVFDPNGNLMEDVCVRLFPPSGISKDFMYKADCTDKNGAFKIDEVPPGNYLMVVNYENEISSSEPFRTLYYPGVFDREKATILSIGLGEFRDGLDIRVPSVEEMVIIRGRFLYADGKPVIDEPVKFTPSRTESGVDGSSREMSNADGSFTLKVLKGQTGKLSGSMWTYVGEFEKCAKLDDYIKTATGGRTAMDINSNEVSITAGADVNDVELIIPFPGCKKAKN
jgi:hypothetical protein